eukprot:s1908_g12.t1
MIEMTGKKRSQKEKKHAKAEKLRAKDASTPERPRQAVGAKDASTPERPRQAVGEEDGPTFTTPLKSVQIDDRRKDHRQTDDQRRTRQEDAALASSEPARLLHRTANLEQDIDDLRDETKYIMDSMSRQRRPSAFLMQQVEAQQNKEAAKEIAGKTWDKYILWQRMQIGNISRTKGIPLKVCMEALSTHKESPFFKNVSVLSIKWKDHAILHGPDTLVYIDFDEVEAIATLIIAPPLFEIIEEQWSKAWDTVNYNVTKEDADSAERQSKGSGKGKTTKWTRSKPYTLQDFPWEIRLAKKKTAAMTRSKPRKRRPEEEEEDEMGD